MSPRFWIQILLLCIIHKKRGFTNSMICIPCIKYPLYETFAGACDLSLCVGNRKSWNWGYEDFLPMDLICPVGVMFPKIRLGVEETMSCCIAAGKDTKLDFILWFTSNCIWYCLNIAISTTRWIHITNFDPQVSSISLISIWSSLLDLTDTEKCEFHESMIISYRCDCSKSNFAGCVDSKPLYVQCFLFADFLFPSLLLILFLISASWFR
jgi:hypothetical protein